MEAIFPAIGFSALFLAIHRLVRWRGQRPFHVDLRLSRGVAALALVTIGFYSLVRWRALWRQGFLTPHDHTGPAFVFLCIICGHLLADLLWLAWGAWRAGSTPRRDLVLHHVLGLGACAVALSFRHGYILLAVVLTTELMPLATAVEALAKARSRPRLASLAQRAGLAALLLWRIPMWAYLLAVVGLQLGSGLTDPSLVALYGIAVVGLLSILAMDGFWTLQMLEVVEDR